VVFQQVKLDHLTHAGAAGGTDGLYSENYSYSSGNLYNKGGVTNTYGDTDHPHAVTARSNGNTYEYDDNGSQTQREIGNDVYDLKYNAESRLMEVKKNSAVIATFTYDGDGKQVKGTVNGVTTYYVGAYYQKEGTVVTKYYYAGVERIAMRQGGVLYYIFGDHLGSTAVVKNTQGGKTELRYTAWGTTRYEYGSTPTDRRFTGQREEASFGLYFYNARWYDPALGRFIQADTIVPGAGNPQAWDRYAYTSNNPVKYSDPSGHMYLNDECGRNGENCFRYGRPDKWYTDNDYVPKSSLRTKTEKNDNCMGLGCIVSIENYDDDGNDGLTFGYKLGKVVTSILVNSGVLVTELTLVGLQILLVDALGPYGAAIDVAIIPFEIALADLSVSVSLQTYNSIENDKQQEFKFYIMPALFSDLPESWQNEILSTMPVLSRIFQ